MTDPEQVAEAVREACVAAVLDAYEEAGVRGLCAEGRWEYAVEALRRLELSKVVKNKPQLTDAAKRAGRRGSG